MREQRAAGLSGNLRLKSYLNKITLLDDILF